MQKSSRLKRPLYQMPDDVRDELNKLKLMDIYYDRPPYQRNDYVSWITRAKSEETHRKRLQQMIEELKDGGLYMKMKYNPKRK
jgi:uncharacterized protein YdeI (YjbR/CyaY-like superfamily)